MNREKPSRSTPGEEKATQPLLVACQDLRSENSPPEEATHCILEGLNPRWYNMAFPALSLLLPRELHERTLPGSVHTAEQEDRPVRPIHHIALVGGADGAVQNRG